MSETNIEHAKLMKPLFINGMFNREGKRIRAKYVKTLVNGGEEYPLWIDAGKPDKDYAKNSEDEYYIMIEANGYLIPCGYTEYELKQRSGYDFLNKEWYGDFEGRNKYFDELRNGKTFEESNKIITEQIAKEELFIEEFGKEDETQIIYLISSFINPCIAQYLEARDKGGRYANFHGAAFLNELDKCVEISTKLKAIRQQEEAVKKAEREERRKLEQEEQEKSEQEAIREAENVFINGGTIKAGDIIVKIADKYGINIPIRTRGWILNTLAECTISDSGSISYRYWKRNGATGSQRVYDIISDIRKELNKHE